MTTNNITPPPPMVPDDGTPFSSAVWQRWFASHTSQVTFTNATASTALAQAAAAIAALPQKLNNSAADVLKGAINVTTGGGFNAGTLVWDSTGARISGAGVAMTARGIVGYSAALGGYSFAIDSLGNATFAGALGAASGTFAGALIAVTGTFLGDLTTGGTVHAFGNFTVSGSQVALYGDGLVSNVIGVYGSTNTAAGVFGIANGSFGIGVSGVAGASNGTGVRGYALGASAYGVFGVNNTGEAVHGETLNGKAVAGYSTFSTGYAGYFGGAVALAGTTSPLKLNSVVGVSGSALISQGAGNTPAYGPIVAGGAGTSNGSGQLVVTFTYPFSNTSYGISGITDSGSIVVLLNASVTTGGCTLQVESRTTGLVVAGANVHWTAVGT